MSDSLWPYGLPCSSVHGILQAKVLEWVAISFSRGSSEPRDQTRVSCIAHRFFTIWAIREAIKILKILKNNSTKKCVSIHKYLSNRWKLYNFFFFFLMGFAVTQWWKNPPANAGDASPISGSGRSSGIGNGNPLQYSCLDNPMDRETLV